ncbi:hypothetical protein [Halomonas cupida]|uniref:hypothetical protein n=1 Tax=Halomonas cupida TaxID=44933 RepID=UPI003A923E95
MASQCWRMLLSASLLLISLPSLALEAPTGQVILEIAGRIGATNAQNEAHFDRDMLEALPQHSVITGQPWIDGQSTFEGPLLRDVMQVVDAQGETMNVQAIRDYKADIPLSDAYDHDVILALVRDGALMRIRDKGPLFVIYPFDEHPELKTNIYYSRSVWQVARIEVR